jgi:hypothetical protein
MKATDLNLSEMPAMTLHGPDGFGLTQYSGDEYALVGGFRDGSSNAGELRLKYQIYSHALIDANGGDFAKGEIGYCVVRVASDDGEDQGDILGLIDIELKPKYRKSGHGKKIVRDIVDTTKSGNLDIHDIQKKAKKFWDKMGVEYGNKQTGSAQNAVLRKQSESLGDFNKDEPMKSTVAVPGYGTMNIDSLMKNVIDQATAMIKQMQQGTQGFRNADYALNRNKVLPTKIAALVQALDDLQAIRAKGGARSRNIENESIMLEDGWFDYYNKFAKIADPIKPQLKKIHNDWGHNKFDPNNKADVKRFIDAQGPEYMNQLKKYANTPGWAIKSFASPKQLKKYGITKDELPQIIALRDKFKAEHPKEFELIKTGQAQKAWDNMRNEAVRENEQEPLPIDITRIMNTIQEYESKQYIPVEDADIMRRGISALQTGRQSLGAEQMSVLQLLTMLSPE